MTRRSKDDQVAIYYVIFLAILIIVAYIYYSNKNEQETREAYANARETYIEVETEKLQNKSFSDVGDESDCIYDCSGHEAGFEWAKDNNIQNPLDCEGDSQSFVEGCESFVNELISIQQNPEVRPDYDEEIKDYVEADYPDTDDY